MTDCWILDDSQGQSRQKETPVAHYSCQRWQVRDESGWSTATSSASAHSAQPLELASLIYNFKAPGSVLERCGHVFVWGVCVSHYSYVSPEWAMAIQSLCEEWERRREAHLDMRSQIIHLTLHQEGSTERRRAKLKESEIKTGHERGRQKEEKQTRP